MTAPVDPDNAIALLAAQNATCRFDSVLTRARYPENFPEISIDPEFWYQAAVAATARGLYSEARIYRIMVDFLGDRRRTTWYDYLIDRFWVSPMWQPIAAHLHLSTSEQLDRASEEPQEYQSLSYLWIRHDLLVLLDFVAHNEFEDALMWLDSAEIQLSRLLERTPVDVRLTWRPIIRFYKMVCLAATGSLAPSQHLADDLRYDNGFLLRRHRLVIGTFRRNPRLGLLHYHLMVLAQKLRTKWVKLRTSNR